SLDLISLDNWLRDPANAPGFQSVCGAILQRPDVYAVEEAFVIEDGTFAIRNSAGAKIAVTPPPGVPVTATAGASGGASGDLHITQPVVFALRRMAPFADGMFAPAAVGAAPGATPAPQLSGAAPQQFTTPLAGKLVESVHLTPP